MAKSSAYQSGQTGATDFDRWLRVLRPGQRATVRAV
jgi:hypothetical protein